MAIANTLYNKMKKIVIRVFTYLLVFYLAISFYMFFMQWRILYPATDDISSLENARHFISDIEEHSIKTTMGSIRAFYAPSKNGRFIVFYYGNRETMARSVMDAKDYYSSGYGFLACSYPGYDGNPGPPKASTLYDAAESCVNFLNDKFGISDNKIIIYGHSLGGHMAVYVSQNRDLNAVILIAPLGSAVDIARRQYPLLPVSFIMQDHLVSYEMAKNIKAPVYLAHNIYDKVVPYEQGLKIYQSLASAKKHMETLDYLIPGDNGHGDLYQYGIKPHIIRYLDLN